MAQAAKKAVTEKNREKRASASTKALDKPLMVNIFEAKTQLSKLVERAEHGEEIILARAGRPVARLTQLQPEKKKIRFGGMKGKIWIADDFDDPLPEEVLAEFEADL